MAYAYRHHGRRVVLKKKNKIKNANGRARPRASKVYHHRAVAAIKNNDDSKNVVAITAAADDVFIRVV